MDIKKLIERGETQSVEFKESLRLNDEIGETVSAFSNSDGGAVIVGVMIEVKEGAEKPVFFKNHAYKRVGKTNQRISSSEMRKLAKESGGRVYWDERVCEDAGLEDVNNNQIYREINGVSDETTRRELSQLVEKGLLKIKGKGRSTKYVPRVGDYNMDDGKVKILMTSIIERGKTNKRCYFVIW